MQQREAGERIEAELMRLAEGRLGTVEVAEPEPDLADLVGPGTGLWQPPERRELGERVTRLVLGLGEPPSQAHDLGALHPADAGEPRDRLAFTPARGRGGPLARRVGSRRPTGTRRA